MNHNKYEVRLKEYIRMEKELDEVREKLRNRPLFELKEPIHRGWMISYVLIPEIANRHDSFDVQQALDVGFHPNHIRNVKHVKMMRSGEKGYWYTDSKGKSHWNEFRPYTVWIKEKELLRLAPQVQKYFYLDRYNENISRRNLYRIFIPKHWVKIRVRPYFVTHSTEVGGEMKKREQFLKDKLETFWREQHNGWKRANGWAKNSYRVRTRIYLTKFLKHEIEDIPKALYKKELKD